MFCCSGQQKMLESGKREAINKQIKTYGCEFIAVLSDNKANYNKDINLISLNEDPSR